MPQHPSPPPRPGVLTPIERRITLLVAAVQFANVLDFMIVLPLGPDFAVALGIPTSHLGYVGGAYTAAAFVAGLVGSLFLDRFDRRRVLALSMLGLVVATALGGFAGDITAMLAARTMAGFFGGPATASALAIVADAVPAERRGRAMGLVGASFATASVLGMPVALELARLGGWRIPFFAIAGLAAVIAILVVWAMPPQRGHLPLPAGGNPFREFRRVLSRPIARLGVTLMPVLLIGQFTLVPSLSAWIQFNLGFPREGISTLYMLGGLLGLFVTRYAGIGVDRWGGTPIAAIGTVVVVSCTVLIFLTGLSPTALYVVFPLMMVGNAMRFTSVSTVSSKIPGPAERGRYMALVSASQHLSSTLAAFVVAALLVELPGGALGGVQPVAVATIAVALALPMLLWTVERWLTRGPVQQVATVLEPVHP